MEEQKVQQAQMLQFLSYAQQPLIDFLLQMKTLCENCITGLTQFQQVHQQIPLQQYLMTCANQTIQNPAHLPKTEASISKQQFEIQNPQKNKQQEEDSAKIREKRRRLRLKKQQKKKNKDPNAPKMPKSAFIFYFKDVKDEFQLKYSEQNMNFQDITKIIAEEWKSKPNDFKEPYILLAEQDRERYNKEQAEYQANAPKNISKYLQKKHKQTQQDDEDRDQSRKQRQLNNITINSEDRYIEPDSFGGDIVDDS